jgi:molybdopterin converting factor small subunit
MQITVHLYSYLRYYMPNEGKLFQEKTWDLPEGSAITHVIEKLNLPGEIRVSVLLNNNRADSTTPLKEGDVVHILPQMAGG